MTITVANTSNTNTFDYWINRTNELADAMTNYVVTTDSNTAVGNAAISDTFTANMVYSETVKVGNSTVNVSIVSPNTSQISSGNYYFSSNGNWDNIVSAPVSNGTITTSGTSQQEIDNFAIADQNAAEYYLHISDNTANNKHISKVLVAHDVGSAYTTEYATIVSNTSLGVFAASSNGTHISFLMTPTSSACDVTFTRVNF